MFLDKPQPPEDLKVDAITPENVTISWSPPTDDGGSPVTEYIIEKRDMKRSTWSQAGTTSETTFTVPKLLEGNSYKFRVRAKNEQGPSEPAETSEPVIAKHQFGEFTNGYMDAIYVIQQKDVQNHIVVTGQQTRWI